MAPNPPRKRISLATNPQALNPSGIDPPRHRIFQATTPQALNPTCSQCHMAMSTQLVSATSSMRVLKYWCLTMKKRRRRNLQGGTH